MHTFYLLTSMYILPIHGRFSLTYQYTYKHIIKGIGSKDVSCADFYHHRFVTMSAYLATVSFAVVYFNFILGVHLFTSPHLTSPVHLTCMLIAVNLLLKSEMKTSL